jgi:amino acid adenylation domain-containing protein
MNKEGFVFPLSFAQQRLWFLDQLEPESPLYNVAQAYRMSGLLNEDALHKTFATLVNRHESLRTTISAVEGVPMQFIAETGMIEIPVIDLKSLPVMERENEARRIAAAEFQKPFDIAQGPLIRVNLLRLDDKEHVLLLNMHHIISDGWSIGILMLEMAELYEAYATGQASPLPELPIQYADFAQWQREWLQGEVLEKQLAYWKKQLGENPPILELPTDNPRPAVQTYRGRRKSLTLADAEFLEELKALSQREDVTLFMTFLAAFQVLIHRYTGQDDIIVGSPIANRNRTEIEGVIGFFVNTLVLRTDLSGDPSFRELLGRVREVTLGAYAHQDLPFEKLVEELQVSRSLAYNPLFQVMFAYQNTSLRPLKLVNLTLSPMEIEMDTAKFDLTLDLTEDPNGIIGAIEYNVDLFNSKYIDLLIGHFKTLLKGIIANPERRISELPILTEGERRRIMKEWNNTRVDYPQDRLIHQIFEARVEKNSDDIAIAFEGQRLTYRELNQRSNQLAHYLQSLGVGPESIVGIAVERSIEMIVGLYGILKAGGAYLPIDPTYPADRVAYMMEDAKVPVLLTQQRLLDKLPPHEVRTIRLDTDWDSLIGSQSKENPACKATLENAAYVIYTSGSTGNPKGVINNHAGILNRLLWMQNAYRLTPTDTVLQKTPFSFDVSVWEFFWPLMFGARLIVARPEGHKDADYLVRTIIEEQITTMHFVPSMLQIFLMAKDVERCTSLRQVICSGEALPIELQNRFFARLKAKLHNLYGPTEAAVDVTYWECRQESGLKTVPIGYPVANTQIYILDRNMQPVPVGIAGELFIGGVQVARGYLHKPELTAEKFIPDPFGENPQGHLYRTGDLCRYLPDGSIEYLGRLDFQVKIRGNRIELGEIEALLGQHPTVREAAVIAREDTPDDKRLVAYIVCNQNQAAGTGELRDFVKQKLPDFMVPSHFIILDRLPLTPNQKVDRKALPAPEQGDIKSEAIYIAPRNELQRTIQGIWQEALKTSKIGMNDNFFELGGHSLLLVRVYYQLCEVIDKDFSLTDLFRFPTIGTLAEYLTGDVGEKAFGSVHNSVRRAEARRAAIARRQQVRQRVNGK